METKTWKGVIFAFEAAWRLKAGKKKWVKIENPVKQNERHARLFKKWLNNNLPDKDFLKDIVYPVVVLKKTAWFKADEAVKMPIVLGGVELVSYTKSIKGNVINDELSKTICEKIKNTKPYKEKKKITFKEGTTKYGKKYVRVRGTLKRIFHPFSEQKCATNYVYKACFMVFFLLNSVVTNSWVCVSYDNP